MQVRDIYNSVVKGASFRHSEWFALWRDDWGIDDYTWIEGLSEATFDFILALYQRGASLFRMIQISPCYVMLFSGRSK
jgi:hypothetical protein